MKTEALPPDAQKRLDDIVARLPNMILADVAIIIELNWSKVNFAAVPYLKAMRAMVNITDKYYEDDGTSIVAYFLGNATTWRGPVAKAVKAELNRRLKGAR